MLSHKASLFLRLDGVVLDKLVVACLDLLLGSLALLGRGLALVVVGVLDSSLLAALLRGGLVLRLGGGERGVCSAKLITVSFQDFRVDVHFR
jgi:hypothetical protein